MTSGFIFLDNSMCNSTVDHRYGANVGCICRFIVTGVDGSNSFLDDRSECRSLTGVMFTTGFILSCPFLGLS